MVADTSEGEECVEEAEAGVEVGGLMCQEAEEEAEDFEVEEALCQQEEDTYLIESQAEEEVEAVQEVAVPVHAVEAVGGAEVAAGAMAEIQISEDVEAPAVAIPVLVLVQVAEVVVEAKRQDHQSARVGVEVTAVTVEAGVAVGQEVLLKVRLVVKTEEEVEVRVLVEVGAEKEKIEAEVGALTKFTLITRMKNNLMEKLLQKMAKKS